MSIERVAFGKTGHLSSRLIFGAAALGGMKPDRALRTLDMVLEHGVNHIDTAASYGDSEVRLADWLRDHRSEVFLATKTGARSGDGARASLERSLKRMGVDQVDMIQLHNLVDPEQHARALGKGGALEALVVAREEGLVRFLGVTGHGTRVAEMHLKSLERYPFDSVLAPYSFSMMQIPEYAADFEKLASVCEERGVALQTIKAIARRRWQEIPERRFSWYEPLRDRDAIRRAMAFTLSRPGLFLNTSSDATLLGLILELAEDEQLAPLASELQADVAQQGIEPLFVRDLLEDV